MPRKPYFKPGTNPWALIVGVEKPLKRKPANLSPAAAEKRKATIKAWNTRNREKMNKYWAAWRKKNKDKRRAIERRYKAKKLNQVCPLNPS